ncbi:hypothetical protein [Luteibacter sp. 9135]|uniref:hypothetical protein n=1 Tax=Luteibacter sp. 9135 TaxID=1500893 RepID=UPI00056992F1|nr:hypothetical protein [Luteibacter sp. 9135]
MKTLMFTIAIASGLAAWTPPAPAQPDRIAEAFDQQIAGGLPSDVLLSRPGATPQRVSVLERLNTALDFPDGTQGTLYLAEVDGRPASVIRVGDRVDVVMDDDTPAPAPRMARFSSGSGAWPWLEGSDLLLLPGNEQPEELTELYGGSDAPSEKTLHVWIFLHDRSGERDYAKFLNWYAAWWIKDMEANVRPGMPIRVSLRDRIPGLTDMDYHAGQAESRIADIAVAGARYVREQGGHVDNLSRFVLFVNEPPRNLPSGVLGGAIEPYRAAIASNRAHRHIFAHEVGHLIGATHEAAENRFFCVTNMADNIIGKAACRVYTKANDQNIRDYLSARL